MHDNNNRRQQSELLFYACGSVWPLGCEYDSHTVHRCEWTMLSCSGRHVSDKPLISQRHLKWARLHLHDSIATVRLWACRGQTVALDGGTLMFWEGWGAIEGWGAGANPEEYKFSTSPLIWEENAWWTAPCGALVFGQCCISRTHRGQGAICSVTDT